MYKPNLDPAYLQRNIESLSGIGGAYDALAMHVQYQHRDILEPYQLATGSKSALELIAEKHELHEKLRKENAQTDNPSTET